MEAALHCSMPEMKSRDGVSRREWGPMLHRYLLPPSYRRRSPAAAAAAALACCAYWTSPWLAPVSPAGTTAAPTAPAAAWPAPALGPATSPAPDPNPAGWQKRHGLPPPPPPAPAPASARLPQALPQPLLLLLLRGAAPALVLGYHHHLSCTHRCRSCTAVPRHWAARSRRSLCVRRGGGCRPQQSSTEHHRQRTAATAATLSSAPSTRRRWSAVKPLGSSRRRTQPARPPSPLPSAPTCLAAAALHIHPW